MMKRPDTDARSRATAETLPHFSNWKSFFFTISKIETLFRIFAEQNMLPNLQFRGYKIDDKIEMVIQRLHALITAAANETLVAESRDTGQPGAAMINECWDLIHDAGLCLRMMGSKEIGLSTRYIGTDELLQMRERWELPMLQGRAVPNAKGPLRGRIRIRERREGHEEHGIEYPFLDAIRERSRRADGSIDKEKMASWIDRAKGVELSIEVINILNLEHRFEVPSRCGVPIAISPELFQLHIGEIGRMVRFYTEGPSSGHRVPKRKRRRMTIDGQRTVELDFSGSLVRLAYHFRDIRIPTSIQDVYAPKEILGRLGVTCGINAELDKILREVVKKITIISLNTDSRAKAVGASRKAMLLNADLCRHFDVDERGSKLSVRYMPGAAAIVDRVVQHHWRIADDFFVDRGPFLVTKESYIMLDILKEFVLQLDRPCLPIHDALIVRESDADIARNVMRSVYHERTGYEPVIKEK